MLHLPAERLAALADDGEPAAPEEAAHLDTCDACAAERRTYALLVSGASLERRAIAAPLTTWDGIAASLRAEGLLAAGPSVSRPASRPHMMRAMRIAAAIALLAGGAVLGRASAVEGPLAIPTATADAGAGSRRADDVLALIPDYRTAAEAEAALARYETAYQHAAAYLAGNDTSASIDGAAAYRTRLAALDRTTRTMREAMEQAPYDPVITGYYLTTLGQREATLRQLNVAVPAGARLNSF